ncbi:thiamine pyrophosphate-binding protein [Faecalicatena contorta]|uniref:Acetolactate synthase-1/2/3 large subunit n=1 Tax=Faecalicatena contorta TaxID=39482 RepID=A0A315ZSE4_9FIRM|nr:thiamine pyrophosphate-binding protein [Faecalicatena contorta]PWJ48219.1 acetolactate synthase-1/2/3 large subunit [Faecalicatena contorta]SUQ15495.1 acetolactate synthase-1/2/3 large subunit [Faecalicatena contorta]
MKLADYVVNYLKKYNIKVVFGYQGSSVAHMIDAISKSEDIVYIQTLHEQAAAFAANGYSLGGQNIGAALACSGPGAINLMNGIANAYYDSLPCIFITGQVSTSGIRGKDSRIRQLGFQETDIVSLVSPITKYAVTIMNKEDIAYQLEKAFHLMLDGRSGPVVIDIPHNIQASMIEPDSLRHFNTECEPEVSCIFDEMEKSIEILKMAQRPLILLGSGARGLRDTTLLESFLINSNIPVVSSYLGKDILDNQSNNYVGVIGAYGNRYANWAVKYCDVLLVMGSRVDGRQTGDNIECFACDAKVIYVNVDIDEINEKPVRYYKICSKVFDYFSYVCKNIGELTWSKEWLNTLNNWKNRFRHWEEYALSEKSNPNKFIYELTKENEQKFIMTTDVGQNQIWTNASAIIKKDCYLIQSGGLGSMGFALPASIGAYYANPQKEIICICGDGGLQMNMQELGTITLNNIPIKIIVFNNESLGLIRVYQEKALSSNFEGSVRGFGSPNFETIAKAYNIEYMKITDNINADKIQNILKTKSSVLVEVCVSIKSTCYPEPTYQSTIDNQSMILEDKEKERIRLEAYAKKEI